MKAIIWIVCLGISALIGIFCPDFFTYKFMSGAEKYEMVNAALRFLVTAVSFTIAIFVARKLCKVWDKHTEKAEKKDHTESVSRRVCPNCGEPLSVISRVCSKCGTLFRENS